ncbi:hypothetical protein [Paenibacillus sp. GM1FR]|uniref:hypothetical protein n=1 Tax=Paenibacillus sp. GM1FR TaxID=2059267 RepID=UPI0013FD2A69|nr:hypothetical protein [Paenibacillus sp. GM1FR]
MKYLIGFGEGPSIYLIEDSYFCDYTSERMFLYLHEKWFTLHDWESHWDWSWKKLQALCGMG